MEDAVGARSFHRQMYVDLIRAYLLDYGSRRDLARALGVKEPFITYILAPSAAAESPGNPGRRAARPPVKTPSTRRAEHIASLLCSDAERRDVLLHHIGQARSGLPATGLWLAAPSPARLVEALRVVEDLHAVATNAADPAAARQAYHELWRRGQRALARTDVRQQPLPFARLLLYLHAAACVLDRADLALEYARRAGMALHDASPRGRDGESRSAYAKLVFGTARAEIVALNNLNLVGSAQQAAVFTEEALLPRHGDRATWLPQLYRDRLTSLRRLHRFAVSEAEILHERASALATNPLDQALLDERLAGALLSHGTPRSVRRARPLVERGLVLVGQADTPLSPLHRAQHLRTAASYARRIGDRAAWERYVRDCLALIAAAGLAHQRRQLERQYGAAAIAALDAD
jgi:hypothetical protein